VCQSNSSVSSCAFDDCAAGLDQSKTFGIFDDEEGGAILDGATGVLELSFAENVATRLFGKLLEADERGFANGCAGSEQHSCGWTTVPYHQ
jgi:hypothetical protein